MPHQYAAARCWKREMMASNFARRYVETGGQLERGGAAAGQMTATVRCWPAVDDLAAQHYGGEQKAPLCARGRRCKVLSVLEPDGLRPRKGGEATPCYPDELAQSGLRRILLVPACIWWTSARACQVIVKPRRSSVAPGAGPAISVGWKGIHAAAICTMNNNGCGSSYCGTTGEMGGICPGGRRGPCGFLLHQGGSVGKTSDRVRQRTQLAEERGDRCPTLWRRCWKTRIMTGGPALGGQPTERWRNGDGADDSGAGAGPDGDRRPSGGYGSVGGCGGLRFRAGGGQSGR